MTTLRLMWTGIGRRFRIWPPRALQRGLQASQRESRVIRAIPLSRFSREVRPPVSHHRQPFVLPSAAGNGSGGFNLVALGRNAILNDLTH